MKNLTKIIWNIATILAVALMSFQCGDDDSDSENIFTEDNYVNEGTLYVTYLTDTLGKLEERILFLQDIINNNQGSPESEKELDQAIDNKNYLVGELDGNEEWVRPAPPCPGLPNGDVCPIRNDIKFITLSNIYSSMSVIFINEQGQQYGISKPELYQVPDGDGLNYQVLNLNEYSGRFTMKIEKVNSVDNIITSYEYNGTME